MLCDLEDHPRRPKVVSDFCWGGSEGEMLWSQDVHLAAEGRERFLSYMLHGDCVPRDPVSSALFLITYFLLVASRLYIRKGN